MKSKKALLTETQIKELNLSDEQIDAIQKIVGVQSEDGFISSEEMRSRAGELLSKIRGEKGYSQRDIAKKLGYKGHNFIYLVERGKSKVPADKVDAFVDAYEADVRVSSVLISAFHPEIWKSMLNQMFILRDIEPGEVDQEVQLWLDEELRK